MSHYNNAGRYYMFPSPHLLPVALHLQFTKQPYFNFLASGAESHRSVPSKIRIQFFFYLTDVYGCDYGCDRVIGGSLKSGSHSCAYQKSLVSFACLRVTQVGLAFILSHVLTSRLHIHRLEDE